MTVNAFDVGDSFIFRVFQYASGDENSMWSNTFEMTAIETGDIADIDLAMTACRLFIVAMQKEVNYIVRGEVGTWVPDSVPYDPEAFKAYEFTPTPGARTAGNVSMGKGIALNISRSVQYGRHGYLYLRNALDTDDVESTAGILQLQDPSGLQTTMQAALASSSLGSYVLNALTPKALQLQLIGKPKNYSTVHKVPVLGFEIRGVTELPWNHRWFNRGINVIPG